MDKIDMILLICAFICFALSTLGVGAKVNLTSLGLALFVLTFII